MPAIALQDIAGIVLAGGRGSRMGGVDKGLQRHGGLALAEHALNRLRPQVGQVMLNANRNLGTYSAMGAPVWPDALPDQPGPLAGFLAGLDHCATDYLVTVPCDSPNFPLDLVARLSAALTLEAADVAIAATLEGGAVQPQPVFCLMRARCAQVCWRSSNPANARSTAGPVACAAPRCCSTIRRPLPTPTRWPSCSGCNPVEPAAEPCCQPHPSARPPDDWRQASPASSQGARRSPGLWP